VDPVELLAVLSDVLKRIGLHETERVSGHRAVVHPHDLVKAGTMVANRSPASPAEEVEEFHFIRPAAHTTIDGNR